MAAHAGRVENTPSVNDEPPKHHRAWGLNLRIAVPFLVFVVVGSLGLAQWLQTNFQRENRELFAKLARTNADFLRDSHLAHSRQTAANLGRVLNVQVYFRSRQIGWTPPLAASLPEESALAGLVRGQGPVRLGAYSEGIAVPLDADSDLILVRATPQAGNGIFRPTTLLIFGVFWGLTLALAVTLTRGIARPLRLLAARLPHIGDDGDAALPGAERRDEIGLLARAYRATHAQLVEERIARAQAERLALLGKMTTGLAHEIHNPLAGIRLHLQLLASAPPAEMREAVAESVPIVLGETAKIETLVNQWMFLVRPEPPQTSPTALASVVDGVVKLLAPLAIHARVQIAVDVPAALRAEMDARRIGQAVGNIVLNAIQAMPGGGTLRVTSHADGPHAVLIFQDTGRGFSVEALAHHTDLFFSEKEGGMGIGLSVTAEIIKAHGGALRVGNGPGGALVTIELPLATK